MPLSMGVPRFYRWLAKRYPAFRLAADAGTQPHVDNLYLDLNGIVHQCARHDRGPGVAAAPDEQIFAEVFAQIAAIVELVGPQRLLFLGRHCRRHATLVEEPVALEPEQLSSRGPLRATHLCLRNFPSTQSIGPTCCCNSH